MWSDRACIVAATGPSLDAEVALKCRRSFCNVIAVNDAYRLMPWADLLYACDSPWWDHHKGAPSFRGERWSSHDSFGNDKSRAAEKFGLNLVPGKAGDGFCYDKTHIHYGGNSGFQAINLAILLGAVRIVLVGFNMKSIGGRSHFFGDHPGRLHRSTKYERFVSFFVKAARTLPPGIEIINATPNTALNCFPKMRLEDACRSSD